MLAIDIDPKEHRDLEKQKEEFAHSNPLKHIAEQWFELKKQNIVEKHARRVWRSLEGHIFPSLGNIPIHKITAQKTIATLEPLAAKDKLETVTRICQRLNDIMDYAVNTGLINANPLSGIKKAFKTPVKKAMPSIKPEELPILMKAISKATIEISTRCLIKWQLHTMVRPNEAAGTRWDEIDFENKLWKIPAYQMKKRKAHIVPLTTQAIDLLNEMNPLNSEYEFVFPADRSTKKPANSETANKALNRMGFKEILVSHGFRSIASTALNEQEFKPDHIEHSLAHADKNSTRSDYNNAEYIESRREIMKWWSNYIDEASMKDVNLEKNLNTLKLAKEKENNEKTNQS